MGRKTLSICSQKVRLVLAEKGLEWENLHLNLRAGEHQKEWYVKLNPRAVVPTLVDGDIVVPESNVINEYLDECFPEPPLKPSDPFDRARVRLWTKQLDEGVHDAGIAVVSFALAFRHQYLARGKDEQQMLENIPDSFKRERRRDVIEKGLPHLRMGGAQRGHSGRGPYRQARSMGQLPGRHEPPIRSCNWRHDPDTPIERAGTRQWKPRSDDMTGG